MVTSAESRTRESARLWRAQTRTVTLVTVTRRAKVRDGVTVSCPAPSESASVCFRLHSGRPNSPFNRHSSAFNSSPSLCFSSSAHQDVTTERKVRHSSEHTKIMALIMKQVRRHLRLVAPGCAKCHRGEAAHSPPQQSLQGKAEEDPRERFQDAPPTCCHPRSRPPGKETRSERPPRRTPPRRQEVLHQRAIPPKRAPRADGRERYLLAE